MHRTKEKTSLVRLRRRRTQVRVYEHREPKDSAGQGSHPLSLYQDFALLAPLQYDVHPAINRELVVRMVERTIWRDGQDVDGLGLSVLIGGLKETVSESNPRSAMVGRKLQAQIQLAATTGGKIPHGPIGILFVRLAEMESLGAGMFRVIDQLRTSCPISPPAFRFSEGFEDRPILKPVGKIVLPLFFQSQSGSTVTITRPGLWPKDTSARFPSAERKA